MIYLLEYTPEAEKDVKKLQKLGDKSVILKLRKFLIELTRHPDRGTGHPKSLRGDRAGQWSRKLTSKHRLVYLIDEARKTVIILSIVGHYDDK